MGVVIDPPPAAAETLRTLRRLRSIRQFGPDPIPDQALAAILDVARWTGSGMNRQPWTFVVVRERATLRAIAEASPNAGHVAGAAAAIILAMPGESTRIDTFDEGRAAERILVAASALGLASALGWVVPGAAARVKSLLEVPDDRTLRTLVSLGYPTVAADQPRSEPGTARYPLNELVRYEKFS